MEYQPTLRPAQSYRTFGQPVTGPSFLGVQYHFGISLLNTHPAELSIHPYQGIKKCKYKGKHRPEIVKIHLFVLIQYYRGIVLTWRIKTFYRISHTFLWLFDSLALWPSQWDDDTHLETHWIQSRLKQKWSSL